MYQIGLPHPTCRGTAKGLQRYSGTSPGVPTGLQVHCNSSGVHLVPLGPQMGLQKHQ
eukprot:CAMPEP_0174376984 /NCGR_PEP_ID=MMETSP0811_2-20130205/120294_1 /TAXON_ID=73025 ORGANISM="Eutreptiella gymnastica-like, Strain CCMP1594" /NCGR_SAMPLE_ID=MMETSP0811_2 /ASSEMBLY_ACC=CAM_ASM_000667 /LENGTH=56 /DNA_ID=CAMNT_0015528759 /DNA_START=100 /DNA_END=267 /DNA_ORIENTATION=+